MTRSAPLNGAAMRANMLDGSAWLKRSFSIWRELDRTRQEKDIGHPAAFSEALVERLIECYVPRQGMTVLDCFAGSGTALVASARMGMRAVGVDINPAFRAAFLDRVGIMGSEPDDNCRYHVGDARLLSEFITAESVDFCVTSPPYWDILNRRRSADGKRNRNYSDDRRDLGNFARYDEFMRGMTEVIGQVRTVLKPRALFIVNVMDLRKGGKFYPLHIDIAREATVAGFSLEDIIIWDRQKEYNNMRPLGYPYRFIINKVHEYLLVLRKEA